MKKLTVAWPWLAAISSGLLYTGCFAPFNFTWLCWIALTPLIAAVWFSGKALHHRWLHNLLLGYVTGLTFFWTTFSWLTTVTVLGWFVLQFYMAIYLALWAWFCGLVQPREIRREPGSTKWEQMLAQARSTVASPPSPWIRSTNNLLLAFLLAAAWVTQEWLRGWIFSGFGWNGLGVALHDTWPMIQIAEFTGVAGLSFMVAFANVIAVTTVCRLILEASTRVVRPHFDLTLTLAAIVGVLTFGIRATQVSSPTKPLRVAAVQSNVPQNQKFDPQFTRKIFDQFRRLSEIALRSNPPPDLLICFEDTIGELTRRFVLPGETNPGANLLVDITNDGWFLHSAGSHQHLANAIFRCVETRRPMIRAANTGVTCLVNEFGRVTQKLQDDTGSTFTEGVLTGDIKVPTEHELTFYTRHGELFANFCALVTVTAIVAVGLIRRRRV